MEISRLPKSFFSTALRKYMKGELQLKQGKFYFTTLDKKRIEIKPEKLSIVDEHGKPFTAGKIRSNVPVKVIINVNVEYPFFCAGEGCKDKMFIERVNAIGETIQYEIDGQKIENGQIVLFSKPLMIYNNWRLFMGECDVTQKANMEQAKIDAKKERIARKNLKNNKPVEEEKTETTNTKNMAWNSGEKAKMEEANAKAIWLICELVGTENRGDFTQTGFNLMNIQNVDDDELYYVSLEKAKELCNKRLIKDVKYENGRFVGKGNDNRRIDSLPEKTEKGKALL